MVCLLSYALKKSWSKLYTRYHGRQHHAKLLVYENQLLRPLWSEKMAEDLKVDGQLNLTNNRWMLANQDIYHSLYHINL